MKKLLVLTMLCLLLAACGNTPVGTTAPAPSPSGTTGTEQQPTPTLPPETTAAELPTEPVETTLLPTAPSPDALIGTWVRTGAEVEGDRNGGGNCTLVIDAAADGTYTATYTDLDFPDSSYADKALHIEDRPMYAYCGNESWVGVVEHSVFPGSSIEVTVLEDGTLLLQNSFTVDGMPMVSYEFFAKQP